MSNFQWDDIDLNAGNIMNGVVSNINHQSMTATVHKDETLVAKNIPIHYHCEVDSTDDGNPFFNTYPDDQDLLGSSAFADEDVVNVMFRGINNTRPIIIGFVNQAKACGYKIRLTRSDGLALTDDVLHDVNFYVYDSNQNALNITASYESDTGYFIITINDNVPGGVIWLAYECARGQLTQYPGRVSGEFFQNQDLIPVGTYEDEIPYQIRFYTRITIDSNQLTHGGQQFYVRYQDSDSVWQTTDTKDVHGNESGIDPDKYFYAGPFIMDDWNEGGVEIHLLDVRTANRDPFLVSQIDQTLMFEYWMEDINGTIPVWSHRGSDVKYCAGPGGIVLPAGFIKEGCAFETYSSSPGNERSFFNITMMDPDSIGTTGEWTGSPGYPLWKERLGNTTYSKIATLYKEFTGTQFNNFLNNTENSIYNWDTSEYEANKIVVETSLAFGLKMLKKSWVPTTYADQKMRYYKYQSYATTPFWECQSHWEKDIWLSAWINVDDPGQNVWSKPARTGWRVTNDGESFCSDKFAKDSPTFSCANMDPSGGWPIEGYQAYGRVSNTVKYAGFCSEDIHTWAQSLTAEDFLHIITDRTSPVLSSSANSTGTLSRATATGCEATGDISNPDYGGRNFNNYSNTIFYETDNLHISCY